MTFLEQIQANNDPNNPDRIKARELLETVNSSGENDTGEVVTTTDLLNKSGRHKR